MTQPEAPKPDRKRYAMNMTLAVMAGQVGCLTLFIIIAAVLGGLWLDGQFNTRPWITIGLLVVSVPVSLFLMYIVATRTIAKIKVNPPEKDKRS